MRAQPYFESESSAGFSVGVGCPSFGGQRTDRGGSRRLRTKVVTGLKPQRPAERAGGLALNSRVEAVSRVAVLCEGLCLVRGVALGLTGEKMQCMEVTVMKMQKLKANSFFQH